MVQGRQLVTLIDSGATSNFIDARVVESMGLKLEETPPYVIEVGNGERVKYQGICEGLEFTMQGEKFKQHFFLMELGGADVVLGMDWLASLGNIEANFGESTRRDFISHRARANLVCYSNHDNPYY